MRLRQRGSDRSTGAISSLAVFRRWRSTFGAVGLSASSRSRRGNSHGGQPFGRGALYHLLQNQIYIGKVVHQGEAHAGQHAAIVPQELWEQVQQSLSANRVSRRQLRGVGGLQLLTGRIQDE